MELFKRMGDKAANNALERLLVNYSRMLDASGVPSVLRRKAADGLHEATGLGEEAAAAHRRLFDGEWLVSTGRGLLEERGRKDEAEEWCIAMWLDRIGSEPYQAMLEALGKT